MRPFLALAVLAAGSVCAAAQERVALAPGVTVAPDPAFWRTVRMPDRDGAFPYLIMAGRDDGVRAVLQASFGFRSCPRPPADDRPPDHVLGVMSHGHQSGDIDPPLPLFPQERPEGGGMMEIGGNPGVLSYLPGSERRPGISGWSAVTAHRCSPVAIVVDGPAGRAARMRELVEELAATVELTEPQR